MKNSTLGRIAAIVFLLMIIGSMLLSTMIPATRTPDSASLPTADLSTAAPTAVIFPTPDPAGPNVVAAGGYVHPSGLFTIMQPEGWLPYPQTTETIASASFVNNTLLSVVHAYTQKYDYAQDVTTLDAQNSADQLAASWSEYDAWRETNRSTAYGMLTIDFELDLADNTYLARHITWASDSEPTLALVVRLVAPYNNPALLDALAEAIIPTFQVLPESFAAPVSWQAYIDQTSGFLIRYGPDWTVAEGRPGGVATLTGAEGTLSLSFEPDRVVADEDAARAWAEAAKSGAAIQEITPVTRGETAGFQVRYTAPDADGAPQTYLAVLLPAEGRGLAVANVLMAGGETDLLAPEAAEAYTSLLTMLDTFQLLPEDAIQPAA